MKILPPDRVKKSVLPRISLYKLTVATVVNMGLTHMAIFGQLPMVTFESPVEAGTPIQNLSDWTVVNGSGNVAANQGYQNTQGLKINQNAQQAAHLLRSIPWSPSQTTAFLDVRIKPAANTPGSDAAITVNGAQIALQRSSSDSTKGEIWVLNGTDDNGPANAQWFLTASAFDLNAAGTASSDFIRLTLRQDFDAANFNC